MNTKDLTSLVHYVVAGMQKSGLLKGYEFNDPDVLQEGYLGALVALKKYDPSAGNKPSTFIVPRIRGAILDYIKTERNAGMSSRRHNLNLVRLTEDVPDACLQCDYVTGEEDSSTLLDSFTYDDGPFNVPAEFQDIEAKVLSHQLTTVIDRMDEPFRTTLLMHYGLLGYPAMSFTEVERAYGTQAGTSYKRLTQALTKLRKLVYVRY